MPDNSEAKQDGRRPALLAAVTALVAMAVVVGVAIPGHHRPGYKKGAPPVDHVAQAVAPTSAPTDDPDPDGALRAALAAWADFPVDADPRPLVVLSDAFGESGFHTGPQKIAFMSGNWTIPNDLPPSPTTSDGYPIISAREALEQLRADNGNGRHEGPPIEVTSIRLGHAPAPTDRGNVSVPAWEIRFTGSIGPNWVPAVAPPARYELPVGTVLGGFGSATTEGGRRLDLTFFGSPDLPGPCGADYSVRFLESAHAVAFRIVRLDRPAPSPSDHPIACDAAAHARTASITLDRPIGNRVLLDPASPADIRGPVSVTIRD